MLPPRAGYTMARDTMIDADYQQQRRITMRAAISSSPCVPRRRSLSPKLFRCYFRAGDLAADAHFADFARHISRDTGAGIRADALDAPMPEYDSFAAPRRLARGGRSAAGQSAQALLSRCAARHRAPHAHALLFRGEIYDARPALCAAAREASRPMR